MWQHPQEHDQLDYDQLLYNKEETKLTSERCLRTLDRHVWVVKITAF